jgi:SAM-dependent methyltransferase
MNKPVNLTDVYKDLHKGHLSENEQRTHSAARIADICMDALSPKSVLDVGCGVGHLMAQLEDRGVDVWGLEGDWLDPSDALCSSDVIEVCDLEQPFSVSKRFDMVVCLEVAEHLEPSRAESFVDDLCATSEVVVFSAAIEGQGGTGHKNEQWQDYWAQLFEDRNYVFYDLFRPQLWADELVHDWFKQNIMLFIRKGSRRGTKVKGYRAPVSSARAIVPKYHALTVERLEKRVRKLRRRLREAKRTAASAKA